MQYCSLPCKEDSAALQWGLLPLSKTGPTSDRSGGVYAHSTAELTRTTERRRLEIKSIFGLDKSKRLDFLKVAEEVVNSGQKQTSD